MEPSEGTTSEELLEYAFAEVYSNHPIAQSIRKAYGKSIDEKIIDDYNEISRSRYSRKSTRKRNFCR